MDSPAKNTIGRRGRSEAKDEEEREEHHQNPFLSGNIEKLSTSRPQFRKETSQARWVEEMGMADVVEKKGNMWTTTGVIRNGKLCCHIEEVLYTFLSKPEHIGVLYAEDLSRLQFVLLPLSWFLAERGALLILDVDGTSISIKDMYKKLAEEKYGCSWESFEAYRHLKLLGYIVGRHGLPWIAKSDMTSCDPHPLQVTAESGGSRELDNIPITQLLKDMQISEISPTFDVYLPNSKFRKSSPGNPSFLLCLLRGKPPLRTEVENLEKKCNGIPFKFCHVDHGRTLPTTWDQETGKLLYTVLLNTPIIENDARFLFTAAFVFVNDVCKT